eukprot:scaffold119826_cov20-Cyclotella_meneghiniana.AAC.1
MADDAANRKLKNSYRQNESPDKHKFNGIMKMRDYREYVIEPVFESAHSTYKDILKQFSSDEYSPITLPHKRSLEDTSQDDIDIGAQTRTL